MARQTTDRPLQESSGTPLQFIQDPRYSGIGKTETDGAEEVYER